MKRFALILMTLSCAREVHKISSRSPELFEKKRDPMGDPSGLQEGGERELYVKEPRVTIKPKDEGASPGSLIDPGDDRLFLFTAPKPAKIGRILTIAVLPSQKGSSNLKTSTGENETPPTERAADPNSTSSNQGQKTDPLEEELLKSLPSLTPGQESKASLLKQFQVEVTQVLPNGDAVVNLVKMANQGEDQATFSLTARIPAERLSAGDSLTTNDLVHLEMIESRADQQMARTSTGWDDEYALRLSGFNERTSKERDLLLDQKKALASAREDLEGKMKAFAAEKRTFVAQRDQLKKEGQGQALTSPAGNPAPGAETKAASPPPTGPTNPVAKTPPQTAGEAKDATGGKNAPTSP